MSELPSTYVVYDRHDKAELRRLSVQDRLVTAAMGGVLSEQLDPSSLYRVLDVACGTGGWVIEAAKQYPAMYLTGIDIRHQLIVYARAQAKGNDRIAFQVMDALRRLEFPSDTFDLVNLRFGVSFMRQWEWPYVISEMLRVTKPGGVVRITETDIIQHSKSASLKAFQEMVWYALQRAGYLWGDEETGLITYLAALLERYGVQAVQTKMYTTTYQSGTEEGKLYVEDVCHAMRTLKPFLQRWGSRGVDYEGICQMAYAQMAQPDFYAVWQLLTAWGLK